MSKIMNSKKRLLYVINEDGYFLSHYLTRAKAAKAKGYDVIVAVGDTGKLEKIRKHRFKCISFPIKRNSINPFYELTTLMAIIRLYKSIKPDLVHNITIKPVIYGSLAGRFVKNVKIVNSINGLGYVFSTQNKSKLLRNIVKILYRIALKRDNKIIFQNYDDLNTFINMKAINKKEARTISGAGVNCSLFYPTPELKGVATVTLASRLLWDKGIKEYIEAARLLKAKGIKARFVLAGWSDSGNPAAIPLETIGEWGNEGIIEWIGYQEDISKLLAESNIVVLPVHCREGTPKILLEAAASQRTIVTTDVPGCREVVKNNINGILVPPKDSKKLADAIQNLLESPYLREIFGKAGRKMALEKFDEKIITNETLELYENLFN